MSGGNPLKSIGGLIANPFVYLGGILAKPLLGALFPKPPSLEPVRIGELSEQNAQEGAPRAIVYGIGRPIGGTLIYMSEARRVMVKTKVGSSGGKGGRSKTQYQDVEHIYRDYALGVCEGPITGIRRIWRNGQLVLDARADRENDGELNAWGAANNKKFAKGKEFYFGHWEQLPSPTLQAYLGTDIPAFRGTAYMVVKNEDLTKSNGAIPQYIFEVMHENGQIITSRPYPIEGMEGMMGVSVSGVGVKLGNPRWDGSESMAGSLSNVAVELRSIMKKYDMPEPEELKGVGVSDVAVELRSIMKKYDMPEPEELKGVGVSDVAVDLVEVKVDYEAEPEIMEGLGVSNVAVDFDGDPIVEAPYNIRGEYIE